MGRHSRRNVASAFTLVELLVVISIIAVMMAILLPALRKARDSGRMATCLANLRQVGVGSIAYATEHDGKLPDRVTAGAFNYRMRPGMRTPNDPAALPETYGWAAVLDRGQYIPGSAETWVCPSQPEWMRQYGNTYAFSLATVLATKSFEYLHSETELLWDNFTFYPGLSGFIGPFSGYTIPTASRFFPHPVIKNDSLGVISLKVGGDVSLRTNEP